MAVLHREIFKGIRPQRAGHLLEKNEAIEAINCKLSSRELRPWLNEQYASDLSGRVSAAFQTIYLYLSSYWFEWAADVDIVESPVFGDTAYRRYYTGDGIPKKTNQTEAITGSGAYPINSYPIGVPAPDIAATAVLGAGGAGDARNVAYVWTVVTSWGEEGPPSESSNIVSALQAQAVDLTTMTLKWQAVQAYVAEGSWAEPTVLNDHVYKCVTAGTSGAAEPGWGTTVDGDTTDGTVVWRCYKKGILHDSGGEKRIYRANTGDTSVSWRLVDTIAITATVYEDTIADEDLEATILPSLYWDNPPDGLIGIVALSGGFHAGFKGKDIYFSEPYYPHAYPSGYSRTVESTVVGLASSGNTLVVMTDKKPEIWVGAHPGSMTPKKLPEPRACVAKRGIVNFPKGILYPSVSGLEWIDGVTRTTITDGFFTKDEWALLYPSTFNAVFHNGAYYGFYSYGGTVGAIVVDIKSGNVSKLDFYVPAVYVEPSTEKMYYVKQKAEVRLLESGTPWPSRTNARLTEAGDYRLLEG